MVNDEGLFIIPSYISHQNFLGDGGSDGLVGQYHALS
jgi:hypothetical protein